MINKLHLSESLLSISLMGFLALGGVSQTNLMGQDTQQAR